jgi:hypothetical protein
VILFSVFKHEHLVRYISAKFHVANNLFKTASLKVSFCSCVWLLVFVLSPFWGALIGSFYTNQNYKIVTLAIWNGIPIFVLYEGSVCMQKTKRHALPS